jgi:hypothetical protein
VWKRQSVPYKHSPFRYQEKKFTQNGQIDCVANQKWGIFFCTTSGELLYIDCEHFPYIPFSKHLQSWRLKIHCASNIKLRNKSFIEGLLLLISRTVKTFRVNDLSRRRFFVFVSQILFWKFKKVFFSFVYWNNCCLILERCGKQMIIWKKWLSKFFWISFHFSWSFNTSMSPHPFMVYFPDRC